MVEVKQLDVCAAGSVFLHDCPYERYIPIYLIVGGVFGIIKNLSNIMQRVNNKRENREDENARTNPFDGTLNCFLFAWFIAGLVHSARLFVHAWVCAVRTFSQHLKNCRFFL